MKFYSIFLSLIIFQSNATTFNQLRKKLITDNTAFFAQAIKISNETGQATAPRKAMEAAAQELHAKGLTQYLKDNEMCRNHIYFEHGDCHCNVYNILTGFLSLPKDAAIDFIENRLDMAIESAEYEKEWISNNHDAETIHLAEKRLDTYEKAIGIMQTFLEETQDLH